MQIIDSTDHVFSCYEEGLFSLEHWRSYIKNVYPSAAEIIEQDSACYHFERDILPVLNAVAAKPEKVQQLHRSFQTVTQHLDGSVQQHFHTALDADVVLYLGLCNGAGWATTINGKPVVLLGIEKIIELNWVDETRMIALLYHELGHLWHRQQRTLDWGGKTDEEKSLWQLYAEGVAMFFEQQLCCNEHYFHQDQNGWLSWCTQNRGRLFAEYNRRIQQNVSIQDFFGDWCSFEGYSDIGYFLGAELVREALKEHAIQQLPNLSLTEIKRLLSLCIQEQ